MFICIPGIFYHLTIHTYSCWLFECGQLCIFSYYLQGFRTAVNEIRLCSRMEELVLMKKSMHHGNSFETYFEKA